MKSKMIALCAGVMAAAFSSFAHANPTPCPDKNIVEVAVADGRFTTLVAAVQAADLAGVIAETPDLTLFAPTDAAFAKLPAGALDALLADTEALKNVLTYHVIPAKVMASTAVTLSEATMLNGDKVALRFDGSSLFINDAKVVLTDVKAKNGVIHVIDTVLLP